METRTIPLDHGKGRIMITCIKFTFHSVSNIHNLNKPKNYKCIIYRQTHSKVYQLNSLQADLQFKLPLVSSMIIPFWRFVLCTDVNYDIYTPVWRQKIWLQSVLLLWRGSSLETHHILAKPPEKNILHLGVHHNSKIQFHSFIYLEMTYYWSLWFFRNKDKYCLWQWKLMPVL